MTVSATATTLSYNPSDAMSAHSLASIHFLDSSDLVVYHHDDATGDVTLLAEGDDYTIAGDGTAGTGTITATAEWPADDLFHVERRTSVLQQADLVAFNDLPAAEIERSLDRAVLIAQEARDRASRAGLGYAVWRAAFGMGLALDAGGAVTPSAGIGADEDLRTDLAEANGPTWLGFSHNASFSPGTAGAKLAQTISVKDVPFSAVANYDAGTETGTNDAAAINAALDFIDTSATGSFEVTSPRGLYAVSGSGDRILEMQPASSWRGEGSLEGVGVMVLPASTATTLIEDNGSAAKLELYNHQFGGADNASLTAVVKLGVRGIQLGTYGRLDNVIARDAPNATAFLLDVNVAAVGDLYSIATRDGLITADGGVGLQCRTMDPIGFTRYGIKLGGIGDFVLGAEFEAPGANATCYFQSRGGAIGIGYVIAALAAGVTAKRLFAYNPTFDAGCRLGPVAVIRGNSVTARFGDSAAPSTNGSGTATAVGGRTLSDSTKSWTRNQWKGAALTITSGTGSGTWAQVVSNTKDTLTIANSSWAGTGGTTPVNGDGYALNYACQAGEEVAGAFVPSGAGHMMGADGTYPEVAILNLFADDIETDKCTVGSRGSEKKQEIYAEGALDFASIPATSAGTPLTISMPGLTTAGKWLLQVTPPTALNASGVVFSPDVSAADTFRIVPNNITAAGAVDLASGTFRIGAKEYA